MTRLTEVDAKWWGTASGTKWHLMRQASNGEAPMRTVCGISLGKLIDFWSNPDRPPSGLCLICEEYR